ncbi:MAG: hypothetical protein II007_14445 [Gammaproteobacteria bacterium]|nr:hypothetical protein [Gammaproteobacteria bacterium]
MVRHRWGWLAALLWLAGTTAAAKLEMQQERDGELLRYHYSWQDPKRKEQQFSFAVPADGEQGVRYRSYRPEMASAEVRQAMLKTAANFKGIELVTIGAPSEGRFQLRGGSDEERRAAQAELEKVSTGVRKQFLSGHQQAEIRLPNGEHGVIPDHLYYINASLPAFATMAGELRQRFKGPDPRPLIEYLLPWVQSLPYVAMANRFANPTLEFRPPLAVLQQHGGDCDSKATLMATILRAVHPDLPLAMVYLPEHAMLAIQLPHASGERYVNLQGRRMLLVDVVGPAMLPIGSVGERSGTLLSAGSYALREVPMGKGH